MATVALIATQLVAATVTYKNNYTELEAKLFNKLYTFYASIFHEPQHKTIKYCNVSVSIICMVIFLVEIYDTVRQTPYKGWFSDLSRILVTNVSWLMEK